MANNSKIQFQIKIRIILICSIFLLLSPEILGQNRLQLFGIVMENRVKLPNAIIRVYSNNRIIDSTLTTGNGRFKLELLFNRVYKLEFIKYGFIPKNIIVDTSLPTEFADKSYNTEILIGLETMPFGLDLSELDRPMAKIEFKQSPKPQFMYNPDFFVEKGEYDALIEEKIVEQTEVINSIEKEIADLSPAARKALGYDIKNYKEQREINNLRDEAARELANAKNQAQRTIREAEQLARQIINGSLLEQNARLNINNTNINTLQDSLLMLESNLLTEDVRMAQERYELRLAKLNAKTRQDSFELIKREIKLQEKEKEIKIAQSKIESARQQIQLQNYQIRNKNLLLTSVSIGTILLIIFFIILYKNYRDKRNINQLLENQNQELEKLSIVARETDNAVVIMSKNGEIEWVNDGFTRLYGYKLHELHQKGITNIKHLYKDIHVENKIEEILKHKNTSFFESLTTVAQNNNTWIQTTLSPVLDEENEVSKLVAIDSNIHKLKNAQEEILNQKHKLEVQNAKITDSIRYAQRIQNSILPMSEEIEDIFENFLFFKPKDIVSGDFAWFTKVESEKSAQYIFAVVDCTGHGVPGAFMSLIGNRALNEIVKLRQVTTPSQILEELDSEIKRSLQQEVTDSDEGMDVAICSIQQDKQNQWQVSFAGAKRPLFMYSNLQREITIIKGNLRSIGGVSWQQLDEKFINHNFVLNSQDILYLTSDGIIDQNSPNRKRFGTQHLTNIFRQNASKPMKEQKILLEQVLREHQDKTEQRDDITVFALKLK